MWEVRQGGKHGVIHVRGHLGQLWLRWGCLRRCCLPHSLRLCVPDLRLPLCMYLCLCLCVPHLPLSLCLCGCEPHKPCCLGGLLLLLLLVLCGAVMHTPGVLCNVARGGRGSAANGRRVKRGQPNTLLLWLVLLVLRILRTAVSSTTDNMGAGWLHLWRTH